MHAPDHITDALHAHVTTDRTHFAASVKAYLTDSHAAGICHLADQLWPHAHHDVHCTPLPDNAG